MSDTYTLEAVWKNNHRKRYENLCFDAAIIQARILFTEEALLDGVYLKRKEAGR